jgi:hypothetical protein
MREASLSGHLVEANRSDTHRVTATLRLHIKATTVALLSVARQIQRVSAILSLVG